MTGKTETWDLNAWPFNPTGPVHFDIRKSESWGAWGGEIFIATNLLWLGLFTIYRKMSRRIASSARGTSTEFTDSRAACPLPESQPSHPTSEDPWKPISLSAPRRPGVSHM